MRKKILFIFFAAVFAVSGCAKKTIVPVANISRLEAEQAIIIAQAEIDEAGNLGAEVKKAQDVLDGAKKLLGEGDYRGARDDANRARDIARKLKEDMLAGVRGKEDAARAIARAKELISEARSLGGNVTEPEALLSQAEKEFESANYGKAADLADQAAEKAQEIIDSLKLDVYKVGTWEKDRDCLWNIAGKKDIYNDPWKWKRIYKANSRIINDPDLIFPGQRLAIPRD
ncbi:MAG: LysM peptidoglycan-binding domain-containing protein [Elusimicrobia bacterium]|nr:LysM peptidoglycan-binding domain-containing protein [Elusimicrobiota bacterium]